MPANVEIKARVHDPGTLRARITQTAGGAPRVLRQTDVFFHAPHGRLKLRLCEGAPAELIYYDRETARGPKLSRYHVARTEAGEALHALLAAALGERGTVRKQRELWIVECTRIHLDQVEGLGAFLELEVMLQPGEPAGRGQRIAREWMERLGVKDADLIEAAYIDLLEGD
jgi:predicted adenylyl cyclase CyaB